jgi:DNA polymerase I-like protein with 3'-5' exonuclease and polymerase domains
VWPSYASFDTEYNPDTAELYRWSLCDAHNNLHAVESGDIPPAVFNTTQQSYTVLIQNALADIQYLSRLVPMGNVKIEDMMLAHSVLWSGEPHSLNYINSLYGTLNRYKHLSEGSPVAYSAYDAWEPMQMWRSYFIPEFKRDKQSWMMYKKYRLPLIEIIDKAQRSGAKVDTARLSDVQFILHERLEGYKARAKEITGDDSFHLGGSKRLKEEIYG